MARKRSFPVVLVFCAIAAVSALAQQDSASKPEALVTQSAPAACVPACRPGYVCVSGTCVSNCNPPCPEGQECTPELSCVPISAPGIATTAAPSLTTENPYSSGTVSLVFGCLAAGLGIAGGIMNATSAPDTGSGYLPPVAFGGLSAFLFTISIRNKILYREWKALPRERQIRPIADNPNSGYGYYPALTMSGWMLYGVAVALSAGSSSAMQEGHSSTSNSLLAASLAICATSYVLFHIGNRVKAKHLRSRYHQKD